MAGTESSTSDTFTGSAAGAEVRKAVSRDVPQIAEALARAFFDDPVFGWGIPDDQRRRGMLPEFFSLFTEELLLHDETYTTAGEVTGAGLWAPPGAQPVSGDPEEFGRRMEELAGVDAERVFEVSKLIDEHHPPGAYHYLQFVGVAPEWQGRGIGSALMAPVLERCDREGELAYLEATSERNKKLYERHGFVASDPFGPAGGPPLFPMWRQPAQTAPS